MTPDPVAPTTLRRDDLTRALVDVLVNASAPLPAAGVVAAVETRLPWTEHEQSRNKSGLRRADTFLRFVSGWLSTLGWLEKDAGTWRLTELGREKLTADTPDGPYRFVYRAYRAARGEAGSAVPRSTLVVLDCLDVLEPGSWTTYGDLAEVSGLSALSVGGLMGRVDHPSAHRVLGADGRLADGFRWADPTRTDDPVTVLRNEGIRFDHAGRAAQDQRITADSLREIVDPEDGPVQRAWLIRGSSVKGKNLVPDWLDGGWCSVPATQVRHLAPTLDRATIARIVEEDYAGKSYHQRQQKIGELDAFINRMSIDDHVLTNDGPDFVVGVVTGEVTSTPSIDGRSDLRRAVTWLTREHPTDLVDLPAPLKAKVSSSQTLIDLSSVLDDVRALLPDETPATAEVEPLRLPPADDSLADATLFDASWLQQTIDLLTDRRQVILYGPPGTGKTYVATRLAQHLAGNEGVTLVQFHPAYGYEDFFEGYRPTTTDAGTIAFELKPGPFRRIVDAARENPTRPYVLVIDEINRANLAKVFGELYFLLEYRDQAVDLLYRSGDEDAFTLPENVFLIGTMNTADRSIALVDAAMRRRFAFRALHPAVDPTKSLLRRWLHARGLPPLTADLLDALNAAVGHTDIAIGPSYFMRDSVHRDGGLDLVWETDILPLLEEYHIGHDVDVATAYALDTLTKALSASPTGSDETGSVPGPAASSGPGGAPPAS